MQPFDFEPFSSNDHNGFLGDCSITLIDKTDGTDTTRREEYLRRVLKTVTPCGLNTFHLGKCLNYCEILCIFRGKGVYFVKYILLKNFIIIICL